MPSRVKSKMPRKRSWCELTLNRGTIVVLVAAVVVSIGRNEAVVRTTASSSRLPNIRQ